MTYLTSGIIGSNLAAVSTGTTTDGEDAQFSLGLTSTGSDGTKWTYVQAGGAITIYDCVAIDENYQAVAITHALGAAGHGIGFAQVAFADNEFGWVACGGSNIQCNVFTSCAADVALFTNTTAGTLDDSSQAGGIKVEGVVAVTAVNTAAATEVIAKYPHAD